MVRASLLALLLVLASPLFATFELDPPAPTERSSVILKVRDIWRDGCVPRNARVTRNGNRVEVRWSLPGGGCPQALTEWRDDVPLGQFAPGIYEVTLIVDDYNGPRTITTKTLIVTEAAPALRLFPSVVGIGGGEVRVREFCGRYGTPAGVTAAMNDTPIAARIDGCDLVLTLPAHAAGPANVRIVAGDRTFDLVNAVRYIDPAAVPDPSLYERLLIPVLFNGPGAFGSEWRTEVAMTNLSTTAVESLPDVARPLPRVNAGETVSLSMFGNRASGLLLFLPRGYDVRFGSLIRDVSRDAAEWGTEMPIVRESDTRERIELLNVPFDPRYRLQLRIYSIDGVSVPVSIAARTATNVFRSVIVRGPCEVAPCNSNQPAYASVDLKAAFPALTGPVRLSIESSSVAIPPLWAFVTVTNNETQDVTVISPQ